MNDPTEFGENKTKRSEWSKGCEDNNLMCLKNASYVFLTVKTAVLCTGNPENKGSRKENHVFISIGAGVTLDYLGKSFFGDKNVKFRSPVMPNTQLRLVRHVGSMPK